MIGTMLNWLDSRRVRRDLPLYPRIIVLSAVASAIYGAILGGNRSGGAAAVLIGAVMGVIHGTSVAAILAGFEIFGRRSRPGRWLAARPFGVIIAVKSVLYGGVIVAAEAIVPGRWILRALTGTDYAFTSFGDSVTWLNVAASLLLTGVFIFAIQVSRVMGGRNLAHLVFGTYHRPRVERRVFLMVDVVGSTAIAERIGPIAFHRLLDDVFRVIAEPVMDHGGEIYDFIGDEMIATWPAGAAADPLPLAALLDLRRALRERGPRFVAAYGTAPRLRAALHAGEVVVGELGEGKREIAFLGDTMNTAARLLELARERGDVLASAEGRDAVTGGDWRELGEFSLRGRAAPLRVCALSPPA